MARLMAPNIHNQEENRSCDKMNEQGKGSSSSLHTSHKSKDNSSGNSAFRKSSFKVPNPTTPSIQSNRTYRATKITVTNSSVSELASKFNAAVLLEEKNKRDRNFLKSTLKHQQQSANKKMVATRTYSGSPVKAAIQFFEKDSPRNGQSRPKVILVRKHSKSVAVVSTENSLVNDKENVADSANSTISRNNNSTSKKLITMCNGDSEVPDNNNNCYQNKLSSIKRASRRKEETGTAAAESAPADILREVRNRLRPSTTGHRAEVVEEKNTKDDTLKPELKPKPALPCFVNNNDNNNASNFSDIRKDSYSCVAKLPSKFTEDKVFVNNNNNTASPKTANKVANSSSLYKSMELNGKRGILKSCSVTEESNKSLDEKANLSTSLDSLMVKGQRLSIAKDFILESVLNDTSNKETATTHTKDSNTVRKNNSFLHGSSKQSNEHQIIPNSKTADEIEKSRSNEDSGIETEHQKEVASGHEIDVDFEEQPSTDDVEKPKRVFAAVHGRNVSTLHSKMRLLDSGSSSRSSNSSINSKISGSSIVDVGQNRKEEEVRYAYDNNIYEELKHYTTCEGARRTELEGNRTISPTRESQDDHYAVIPDDEADSEHRNYYEINHEDDNVSNIYDVLKQDRHTEEQSVEQGGKCVTTITRSSTTVIVERHKSVYSNLDVARCLENGNSKITGNHHIDSDSSLELVNSLYGTKSPSVVSPGSSLSNISDHAEIVELENTTASSGLNTLATSITETSDEWVDIENTDDEHEVIVYRERCGRRRRGSNCGWVRKVRRQQSKCRKSISISSNSYVYFESRIKSSHVPQCKPSIDEDGCKFVALRSLLHPVPKYEAQELSIYLEPDENEKVIHARSYENIEDLCDDFDDSFDSDSSTDSGVHHSHTYKRRSSSRGGDLQDKLPSPPQNIYGFVKKAGKTVRKRWTSLGLSQIRKMSVGAISSFPTKDSGTGTVSSSTSRIDVTAEHHSNSNSRHSMRWSSFKSRLRHRYSTVSMSTSTFYLDGDTDSNPSTRNNSSTSNIVVNDSSRKTHSITSDHKPGSAMRPTSPPPPPPMNKNKSMEDVLSDKSKGYRHSIAVVSSSSGISTTSWYTDTEFASSSAITNSDQSTYSENDKSAVNSSVNSVEDKVSSAATSLVDTFSETSSCRESTLHTRFTNEPLYQFYTASVAHIANSGSSLEYVNDSECYEEIGSNTSRPSAMELITPCPNGHGQYRSLWCEVPEVRNSGILDTLSIAKQRLQEAKFEIITSEASYFKSLTVLEKHFASNPLLKDELIFCKNDWKVLFGNVASVRKCSENLLASLENCWQESILLSGICDALYRYAADNFGVYVKYCSNQIYIDRTLKSLRDCNSKFVEIVAQLENDPVCQSLSLHSFLMLPMQRITRLPLLVDAVLSRLDPVNEEEEYKSCQLTLASVNKVVQDCNEGARKLERYEEMLLLSRQLEFSRKDVKAMSVASSSRWLIRSGPMVQINAPEAKLTFTKKLTKHGSKLYFFLFNDILFIAKKRSEENYVVLDYCARNLVQISTLEEPISNGTVNPIISPSRFLIMLTMLENHEGKTVEMVLNCDSESSRQRWLEAISPPVSNNPEEVLYEEWDCPQVSAVHSYTPTQPDELSLQPGDTVKVLKKMADGWYHGERIRDGVIGWFPGNYTTEIASQHARAKNLKLRYRLLTLSANYLLSQDNKQHKKS